MGKLQQHIPTMRTSSMSLTEGLVAQCYRPEPDPGHDAETALFTDVEYENVASQILASHGSKPLWVFAYGSLLWKPAQPGLEWRIATAKGWHRSFCLEMRRWRGSPDFPGLMMALRAGGSCVGIAVRLPDVGRLHHLVEFLRREIGGPRGLESLRSIDVAFGGRTAKALCFYADPPEVADKAERSEIDVAQILARACGHIGSGAEYLFKTVQALDELGIHDAYMWRLQELVAAEISNRLTASN
jgi:cation transport protein ChaC